MRAFAMVVVVHAPGEPEPEAVRDRLGAQMPLYVRYIGELAELPVSDEYSGLVPTYGAGIPQIPEREEQA